MPENIGRRKFLKTSLTIGGAALAGQSFEERVLGAESKSGAPAGATVDPLTLPKGKIKNLEISRVICGGNLIGGWAHARDLIYVSPLVKAYHTDEKVFETFRLAEQRGVNTVLTNPASDRVINEYWKRGGKIQWISDCATGNIQDGIKRSVDSGAHAVYLQGGRCDKLVKDGNLGEIEKTLSFMQNQKVPCGLGAHCLETVRECVLAKFEPDFWVKTLHRDDYWSATPVENRRIFDELRREKEHGQTHDNMWCIDPKETIEFMARLKKPWIAFKVLAAGAIHPRRAFQWCFENGADILCVGMFDFQVVEDTAIAEAALKAVAKQGRPRPWMA
ncbi:MAG: hypothetical protein FJ395_07745 [Verrucomicrobia bacterium]|nr:hypothetical protein [Verrucomicrobiota bacterium]